MSGLINSSLATIYIFIVIPAKAGIHFDKLTLFL